MGAKCVRTGQGALAGADEAVGGSNRPSAAKAEEADSTPLQDGLSIPAEIKRREERLATLKAANAVIEERAAERHQEKQLEYEEKLAERERKQRETGRKPPRQAPAATGGRH